MPVPRRILSLWFCRLGAERILRRDGIDPALPLAVVEDTGNRQVLSALSPGAQALGLRRGQPLREARSLCPDLLTRLRNPEAEAGMLTALRRWAGRYSPWIAESGSDGLVLDITGCARLFGGEEALLTRLEEDCAGLGLTARGAIADTPGGAWALARYAGARAGSDRSGDAIDQEARATRSRATRRHWDRGGSAPVIAAGAAPASRIAPPGQLGRILAPLPVAALRLAPEVLDQLNRLGLRRIGDLAGQPRGPLARRFGQGLVLRLDQALGHAPEPVSPRREAPAFATRLTLPDPIGLEEDLLAGLDRLLPRLCDTLRQEDRAARQIRLEAWRSDGTMQWVAVGLARPTTDPARIRPLLVMKLAQIDAGFGIDMLRLIAARTEAPEEAPRPDPLPLDSRRNASPAWRPGRPVAPARDDLLARIGARIGLEALTRRHPGASHIPEKGALTLAAAWSDAPDSPWMPPPQPRPLRMWPPEPAPQLPPESLPPRRIRWRRQDCALLPHPARERIAPEWWLADPAWRSGTRDYVTAVLEDGRALWLFLAHGADLPGGWFCQGSYG
ncbi:DNA polymerase Y family protein [Pseudooceanicola sp. CBS1P-1]|uniref:DNA-directed DNA polymerase n=1 Tax=Pseudooceanicola albus TaxID=2692189 RepID=A0A6L7G653_9RHOB|nr:MULTISPECIES: DNA polymerase Y family protein [Pseudooceanicola]MBT9384096.1 DNA polymerase Y family protein [Pseudooceanicola endophyticus]MXN19804.1 DNA polymerase Y family protein [Pseudooceanicola albus]